MNERTNLEDQVKDLKEETAFREDCKPLEQTAFPRLTQTQHHSLMLDSTHQQLVYTNQLFAASTHESSCDISGESTAVGIRGSKRIVPRPMPAQHSSKCVNMAYLMYSKYFPNANWHWRFKVLHQFQVQK